jgi:hypothetical protein
MIFYHHYYRTSKAKLREDSRLKSVPQFNLSMSPPPCQSGFVAVFFVGVVLTANKPQQINHSRLKSVPQFNLSMSPPSCQSGFMAVFFVGDVWTPPPFGESTV